MSFSHDEKYIYLLIIDQVVDATTLNGTAITLSNWRGGGRLTDSQTLTGGDAVFTTFNHTSTEVEVQLLSTDLNIIKQRGRVCDTAADCWITFTPHLLQDKAGNLVRLRHWVRQ